MIGRLANDNFCHLTQEERGAVVEVLRHVMTIPRSQADAIGMPTQISTQRSRTRDLDILTYVN